MDGTQSTSSSHPADQGEGCRSPPQFAQVRCCVPGCVNAVVMSTAYRNEVSVFLAAEPRIVQMMQVHVRITAHHAGGVLARAASVFAEPPFAAPCPRLAVDVVGVAATAGPSVRSPHRSGSRVSHCDPFLSLSPVNFVCGGYQRLRLSSRVSQSPSPVRPDPIARSTAARSAASCLRSDRR